MRIGWNFSQVKQSSRQIVYKVGTVAKNCVTGNPFGRKKVGCTNIVYHLHCQLGFCFESDAIGYFTLFPSVLVVLGKPFFRQKKPAI